MSSAELTIPAAVTSAARNSAMRPPWPSRAARGSATANCTSGSVTVARALIAAGRRAGRPVAIWSPNTHHWVLGALGALYAGATLVPVNTRFTGPEALDVISRSRARVLIVAGPFLGTDRLATLIKRRRHAERNRPAPVPDNLSLVIRVPIDSDARAAQSHDRGIREPEPPGPGIASPAGRPGAGRSTGPGSTSWPRPCRRSGPTSAPRP